VVAFSAGGDGGRKSSELRRNPHMSFAAASDCRTIAALDRLDVMHAAAIPMRAEPIQQIKRKSKKSWWRTNFSGATMIFRKL